MRSGIYCIYNFITNKFYIGSATRIYVRLGGHRYDLRLNKHDNDLLQNAWNKYGEAAFEFHIIEYCEVENLLIREQWWFDLTHCWDRNVGYNLNPIASSNLGRKFAPRSQAHKDAVSKAHKGKIVSEETKRKISLANKGRILSKEHRQKISQNKKGFKYSEEAKFKMPPKRKGWNHSEETKKIISEKNKGSKRSDEARAKMSNKAKGRIVSEETKEKMREAHHKRLTAFITKVIEI